MFSGAFVSLMILIGEVGPAAEVVKNLSHSSPDAVVAVGCADSGCVGTTKGAVVFVGNGVGAGVFVGGTGVAVGSAASVSAIMVNAAATAVP